MEKDDKIRHQQAKMNGNARLSFAAVALMLVIYLSVKNKAVIKEDLEFLKQQEQKIQQKIVGDNSGSVNTILKKLGGSQKAPNVYNATLVAELEAQVKSLDAEVRAIKKTGVIMETNPTSIQKTSQLRKATRKLLKAKYGDHDHYRVRVDLEFQPSIPDFAEKGKDGSIVIEMAPIELQPVSVYNFLEIARTWIRGAFHRNAPHVLQVQAVSDIHLPLPFQEYSQEFPHKKGTTGYAGRPSGPGWYVSIQDNSVNHGPGSQQSANPYEADANFGTVVEGFDDVVPRIHSVKEMGWLKQENQIKIIKKTILVADDNVNGGAFVEWKDPTKEEDADTTATEE